MYQAFRPLQVVHLLEMLPGRNGTSPTQIDRIFDFLIRLLFFFLDPLVSYYSKNAYHGNTHSHFRRTRQSPAFYENNQHPIRKKRENTHFMIPPANLPFSPGYILQTEPSQSGRPNSTSGLEIRQPPLGIKGETARLSGIEVSSATKDVPSTQVTWKRQNSL